MSVITDTWRQLVRRRLWPIAVLLLGALVAVPMLLAKSPAAVPPPAAPAQTGEATKPVGGGLEAQPVVDVADTAARGTRHVLGARKDPFAPAPQPKPKKTPATKPIATPTPTGGTGLTSPGGTSPVGIGTTPTGGSTPPVTVTPTTPTTPVTPTIPVTRHRKPAPGTLTVRFGDASSDALSSLRVRKLDALPDSDQPVAIYTGTGHHGRTARFLVDSSVKPEGDGRCLPSPADCQTVELRAGETEFFTVTADSSSGTTDTTTTTAGTQFELDVVHIAGRAKKARAARAHHSRATGARTARAGRTIARVVRLLHP